jgi:hypothetical protein
MDTETETKTTALVATVGKHAQTLRSLLRRNLGAKDQDAIRSILEAHEGYIKACEEELIERVLARQRAKKLAGSLSDLAWRARPIHSAPNHNQVANVPLKS